MKTDCKELFRQLGWHCSSVDDVLYVSTPLRLPGGKSLDFYVEEAGPNLLRISDDGLTMFALRSLGYGLEDKRHWRSIKQAIAPYGFELADDGVIQCVLPSSELASGGGRVLGALAAIANWEVECRNHRDEDFSLSIEVERLLRLKGPNLPIVSNPRIEIPGLPPVEFSFQWGNIYVDALAPTAQSVSSRLRKTLILRHEIEAAERILFIVDDRFDDEAAAREVGVLAQLAGATRLSDFAAHYATRH